MKYYDDPLAAAYMCQNHHVAFLKGTIYDDVKGVAARPTITATTAAFMSSRVVLDTHDNPNHKYIIHPDSLHIFEPQEGDVVQVWSSPSKAHYSVKYKRLTTKAVGENISAIIQRNGKPFFMPKEQTDD